MHELWRGRAAIFKKSIQVIVYSRLQILKRLVWKSVEKGCFASNMMWIFTVLAQDKGPVEESLK